MKTTFHSQQGFGAIAYIIFAIVLLAILTAAIATNVDSSLSDSRLDQSRTELFTQAGYIDSAITDCYNDSKSKGNAPFQGYPQVVDGTGTVAPVPLAGAGGVKCPTNYQTIWSKSWFHPRAIEAFEAEGARSKWYYVKNSEGVSIAILLNDRYLTDPTYTGGVVQLTVGRFADGKAHYCDVTNSAGQNVHGVLVYYITRANGVPGAAANLNHCDDYRAIGGTWGTADWPAGGIESAF